jgi:hypothetical protein
MGWRQQHTGDSHRLRRTPRLVENLAAGAGVCPLVTTASTPEPPSAGPASLYLSCSCTIVFGDVRRSVRQLSGKRSSNRTLPE